jgi:hypothetical protein
MTMTLLSRHWIILGIVLVLALTPALSKASTFCTAIALIDTTSLEDAHFILHRGEVADGVTQYSFNRMTGEGAFCQRGGLCYPRYVTRRGQRIEALHLKNCTIGKGEPFDADHPQGVWIYSLDIDPSLFSSSDVLESNVDDALVKLGMCNACAGNAAHIYVHLPHSSCSALIKSALVGDKPSIDKLLALDSTGYFLQSEACIATAPML